MYNKIEPNWDKIRIELAKESMLSILKGNIIYHVEERPEYLAQISVKFADALIKELKK